MDCDSTFANCQVPTCLIPRFPILMTVSKNIYPLNWRIHVDFGSPMFVKCRSMCPLQMLFANYSVPRNCCSGLKHSASSSPSMHVLVGCHLSFSGSWYVNRFLFTVYFLRYSSPRKGIKESWTTQQMHKDFFVYSVALFHTARLICTCLPYHFHPRVQVSRRCLRTSFVVLQR